LEGGSLFFDSKGYCSISVGFGEEDTVYEACAKRTSTTDLEFIHVCSVTCMRLPVERLGCDMYIADECTWKMMTSDGCTSRIDFVAALR
jgi:hypothetical protein